MIGEVFHQTLTSMLLQQTEFTMRQRVLYVPPNIITTIVSLEHVYTQLLLSSPHISTHIACMLIVIGGVMLQALHVKPVATRFTASFPDCHDTTDSLKTKVINPIPKVVS